MVGESLDLCISVVSGNDPRVTLDCLASLLQSLTGSLKVEVHLVDNASPRDWFDKLSDPRITVHSNAKKRGFGANHNSIIGTVKAKYYLLLNDDTLVMPGSCEALVRVAEHNPRAGFFGAKLINADQTVQPSVFRFPSLWLALSQAFCLTQLLRSLPEFDDYKYFGYDELRPVDFVSGAALLARKTMLDQIGLLDERFFMYGEETDWCMRARKAGWQTLFVPTARVVHYGGLSTQDFAPQRSMEFIRSHAKLIEKHFGRWGLLVYRILNLIKHFPRFALACLLRQSERSKIESDMVLWSLGLLKRQGLSELANESSYKVQPVAGRS